MTKSYIIGLIAIIAGIVILLSASKDVTTYATFTEANSSQKRVKISGALNKEEDIDYDPLTNPNAFSFYMIDTDGKSSKVILKKPKPQDFERSESVVVTGKMQGETFIADEVLLKCPSKYKDEELQIRGTAS